jgi:hypothetical protein
VPTIDDHRTREYTIDMLAAGVERVSIYAPERLVDALSLFGQTCFSLGAIDVCQRLQNNISNSSMHIVFSTMIKGLERLADEQGKSLFDVLGKAPEELS